MVSILLVAHTPLASSLQAVARHAFPDCGRLLAAVDVGPGATLDETEQRVRAAIAGLPEGDVLILADVFGATPCSAALAAGMGSQIEIEIEGADAQDAMDALRKLIESKFGEGE